MAIFCTDYIKTSKMFGKSIKLKKESTVQLWNTNKNPKVIYKKNGNQHTQNLNEYQV